MGELHPAIRMLRAGVRRLNPGSTVGSDDSDLGPQFRSGGAVLAGAAFDGGPVPAP
jgi:hypothetical protein